MPPIRRKIKFPATGELKEAEMVDANDSKEFWNEHYLSDGTILKMKMVVSEVWRIIGEYDGDGNPIYVVKSGNVINTIAPDALRRPN